jgi:hypothetical protein
VLTAIDSDNDRRTDIAETTGYCDQFGKLHTSDPDNPDSDNDGNTDDIESGIAFINKYGQSYWKITGDTLKVDTDGDGASDYNEIVVTGTDPMVWLTVIAPEILTHISPGTSPAPAYSPSAPAPASPLPPA